MASVNKWIGIGNLGADPETRYAPNGDAVCNIRIACTESWRDKATGEKKETTEWVRVVFFGKVAEIADKYLKKGSSVYIEGRLQTRKWQDKEGRDQFTTEIRADQMQMLGGKPEGQGGGQQQSSRPARNDPPAPRQQSAPANSGGGGGNFGDFDDDIPFGTNHIGADPVFKKLKLDKD